MKKLFSMMLLFAITLTLTTSASPTLKQSYDSQIGVREKSGNNDGSAVKMYLSTVSLSEGYPWCAAFVKWNLLNSGFTQAYAINGMALSCHRNGHLISNKDNLEPGDVFTLYYAKLRRIGHTGFFDKKINSTLYRSVEGNTNEAGSREGDGVYRKYRSFRATYSFSRWTS